MRSSYFRPLWPKYKLFNGALNKNMIYITYFNQRKLPFACNTAGLVAQL